MESYCHCVYAYVYIEKVIKSYIKRVFILILLSTSSILAYIDQ